MDEVSNIAGVALGLVLTLMIYSYLLGDNPLFRLATHVMAGIGTAYAAVVVIGFRSSGRSSCSRSRRWRAATCPA